MKHQNCEPNNESEGVPFGDTLLGFLIGVGVFIGAFLSGIAALVWAAAGYEPIATFIGIGFCIMSLGVFFAGVALLMWVVLTNNQKPISNE